MDQRAAARARTDGGLKVLHLVDRLNQRGGAQRHLWLTTERLLALRKLRVVVLSRYMRDERLSEAYRGVAAEAVA